MPAFLLVLTLLTSALVLPATATSTPAPDSRTAWPPPASPAAWAPPLSGPAPSPQTSESPAVPPTQASGSPADPPVRTPGPRAATPHASASRPDPPSRMPRARFGWPLAPPRPVVRPFEAPSTPFGPGHRGVDLGAPPGAAVTAAGEGVVVYAGPLAGRGVVSIAHADGLRTTYEPVTAVVAVGGRVTRGSLVGHLAPGHGGCPRAACLHWGARRGAEYVDPLGLLVTGRVRLLPWDGRG